MLIKEKTVGDKVEVNGRLVGDGRKQRPDAIPRSAASPTVATEAIFTASVIDAKEKRDVATMDLPGAFLSADQDEILHMVLRGKIVELLIMAGPEIYTKFVCIGKYGKMMLHVKLL